MENLPDQEIALCINESDQTKGFLKWVVSIFVEIKCEMLKY
jgi:hypothetical protein